MLQAILFDLDGTLADTNPLHYRAWERILRDFDRTLTPAFYADRISGRTNAEIIADILPQLDPAAARDLADRKEAQFRDSARDLQPLAGLHRLLDWARDRRLRLGVVTNAPPANARFMLAALNLQDAFETLVLAEDAPPGKPDPAPYRLGLDRLETPPERAIAFEDSPSGARSAVGAGIRTFGMMTTHGAAELEPLGVCGLLRDFSDRALWDLLETLDPTPVP